MILEPRNNNSSILPLANMQSPSTLRRSGQYNHRQSPRLDQNHGHRSSQIQSEQPNGSPITRRPSQDWFRKPVGPTMNVFGYSQEAADAQLQRDSVQQDISKKFQKDQTFLQLGQAAPPQSLPVIEQDDPLSTPRKRPRTADANDTRDRDIDDQSISPTCRQEKAARRNLIEQNEERTQAYISALDQRNTRQEIQIGNQEGQIQSLESAKVSLTEQNSGLLEQSQSLRVELNRLEDLKAASATREQELRTLQAKYDRSSKTLSEHKIEIRDLRQNKIELQQARESLTAKDSIMSKVRASVAEKDDRIQELENRLQSLGFSMDEILATHKEEMQTLEDDMVELRIQNKRVHILQGEVDKAGVRIQGMESTLKDARGKEEKLVEEIKGLQKWKDELVEKHSDLLESARKGK